MQGLCLAIDQHIGDAEIAKQTMPSLLILNQNVGWLHILMDETRLVTSVKCQGGTESDFQNGIRIASQVLTAAYRAQRTILHQLKITLLTLKLTYSIIVHIHEKALPIQAFHQRQHFRIIMTSWEINLEHLAIGLKTNDSLSSPRNHLSDVQITSLGTLWRNRLLLCIGRTLRCGSSNLESLVALLLTLPSSSLVGQIRHIDYSYL